MDYKHDMVPGKRSYDDVDHDHGDHDDRPNKRHHLHPDLVDNNIDDEKHNHDEQESKIPTSSPLSKLPSVLIPGIAEYLSAAEVSRCSQTSKTMNQDLQKERAERKVRRLAELRGTLGKTLGMDEKETKGLWDAMKQDNAYWFDLGLLVALCPSLLLNRTGPLIGTDQASAIYFPDRFKHAPDSTLNDSAVGQYLRSIGFHTGLGNNIFIRNHELVRLRDARYPTYIHQLDNVQLDARQDDWPVVDVQIRPSVYFSSFAGPLPSLRDFLINIRCLCYDLKSTVSSFQRDNILVKWSVKQFHPNYRHLYVNGFFVCTQWRPESKMELLLKSAHERFSHSYCNSVDNLHVFVGHPGPWINLMRFQDYQGVATRFTNQFFIENHPSIQPA